MELIPKDWVEIQRYKSYKIKVELIQQIYNKIIEYDPEITFKRLKISEKKYNKIMNMHPGEHIEILGSRLLYLRNTIETMEIEQLKKENEQLKKDTIKVILKHIMFEEKIEASFQYNSTEILFLTNKRGIIIGKKFVTPESQSLPGVIPGAGLMSKAKSLMGKKEVPLLYIDAFPVAKITNLHLEENLLKKQGLMDSLKKKVKDKVGMDTRKTQFSHVLTLNSKEFNVEKEFLREVWRTFRYMAEKLQESDFEVKSRADDEGKDEKNDSKLIELSEEEVKRGIDR